MTEEKDDNIAKQNVKKVLESLTDRERKSLQEWLKKTGEISDLNQIGQDFKVTRRKIQEIEAKALRKLKKKKSVPPDDVA